MEMDDKILLICALAIVALLAVMALIRFAIWLQWFRKELRYLDKEIARTEGEEQAQWIHRRKKLIRSIFTFGRF